jgi:hypothetical protein
LQNLNLV